MALRDRDDAAGYTELISFRFVDAINRNVMDIVFFSFNKQTFIKYLWSLVLGIQINKVGIRPLRAQPSKRPDGHVSK